jgi:hypothetical protein
LPKLRLWFLRIVCTFVLVGILVAGLWPFHAPRNEVRWLNGRGLYFGRYGSVVSAEPLKADASRTDGACSLEIWLEPRRVHSSGTILAFYWPESRIIPFALRQSLGDLILQRTTQDQFHHSNKAKIYVDDVFSRRQPVLVTISSGLTGTTVYADGAFVKQYTNFRFSRRDLTGQFVIGNSPVTTDDWSGQMRGFAVYDRELTADEIAGHFANWTKEEGKELAPAGAVALYLFNEQSGNIVHNQIDSATDLLIPERFFVLHEQVLERPWDEFRRDWNYWKDVGINVAGFIPLGFSFFAYFSGMRSIKRPGLVTAALGFFVSLTIEVLQSFLPTRDSGMTDLITNTLGTAIGVLTFKYAAAWGALAGSRS